MKRDWFVLHVKPRTEKKVIDYIRRYGYFGYLPLYTKVSRIQRRKVRRQLPCFPGYVFARLFPEERIRMLKTNLLVNTIPVPDPRRMVHQLRQVTRASRVSEGMRPCDMCKVGDYVKVIAGPMYGMEGYVVRSGRKSRLCLNVEILGAAVEVSISPEDVEKAD